MPVDSMRILFIDDEIDYLKVAADDLRDSLEERKLSAEVVTVDNVDGGIQELQSADFHLAVVDLKFESSDRNGNEIIETILNTKILPIIVLSGYRHELREEFAQHGLIYNTTRKQVDEVVEKIVEWNQKEVFSFFSEAGFLSSALRTALQQTMWNHVSRYWQYIEVGDPTVLQRIAGRIAATLFYDVLAFTPDYVGAGGEVPIHHGEIYIFDTPRDSLAVGDILEIEGKLLVVLSPSCDLVTRPGMGPKTDMILLALCHDLNTYMSEHQTVLDQVKAIRDSQGKKKGEEKARERLLKLMRQDWENPSGRYFFLPPFADFNGGVIDFLKLQIEPYGIEEAGQLTEQRVVCLNREMAAELATRFARYMIRLGQPAYDPGPLIKAILDTVQFQ